MSVLLLAFFVCFVTLANGNSQDDNLEDKMRKSGPELPTIDNIVQASKDNIDLILSKQLKENMPTNAKNHRPLLLALV